MNKRSILTDDYVLSALVNVIGNSIVFYLVKDLGFFAWGLFIFLTFFKVAPSVATALIRIQLLQMHGFIRKSFLKNNEKIVKTEGFLKVKDRKIYHSRVELLKKKSVKIEDMASKVNSAIDLAINSKYGTVRNIHHIMGTVILKNKEKIFMDKK